MSVRRTGLLGGSFNPVHLGHLVLAQDVLEQYELDEVLFVPCARPAHKRPDSLLGFEHRLNMLNLATECDLHFSVSDIERRLDGISYTVDTVRALQENDPDRDYVLIMGADSLLELHTWHRVYELLDACRIVSACRPGSPGPREIRERILLSDPWPERLASQLVATHWIDISSTEIRMRVAEGMRISYLVPSSVEMYIAEHHLYCG